MNNVSRRPRARSPLARGIRRDWQLILIGLIPVLFLVIFSYIPMGGILYAFQKVSLRKSFWQNEWVGLRWFRDFFNSVYCVRVIKNTFILNFWSLVAGTSVEILLALTFNEVRNGPFKRITQSLSYFPNFVSTTVVIGMMVTMLNPRTGVLSLLLQKVFGMEPIDMFVQPSFFRPMYVISGIWQGAGWGSIIYLGAINGIDPQLYEAATIDGAGKLRQAWHITLTGILPTITVLFILRMGSIMNIGHEKILLLQNSLNMQTSDVISTYVYRRGLEEGSFSFSTAVGLFNSVINTALVVFTNAVSKRLSETSLW